MVDETRVLRLLRSVTDDLGVLRAADTSADERRADPLWIRAVKCTFVTAIAACVDVAQHLCSAQGWGTPHDNGDAMRLVGRHSVLDLQLAERMRQAVGFRNLLGHDGGRRDRAGPPPGPGDLELFSRQVAEWVVSAP